VHHSPLVAEGLETVEPVGVALTAVTNTTKGEVAMQELDERTVDAGSAADGFREHLLDVGRLVRVKVNGQRLGPRVDL
jgi:hypothetical protein